MDTFEDTLSLSALLADVCEDNCGVPLDFGIPITTQSQPNQTVSLTTSHQVLHSLDTKTVIATNNTSNLGTAFESFPNGSYGGTSMMSNSVNSITTSLTYSQSVPSNSSCTVSNSVTTSCSVLHTNASIPQRGASTQSLQTSSYINDSRDKRLPSNILHYDDNNLGNSNFTISNEFDHCGAQNGQVSGSLADASALSNGTGPAPQSDNTIGQPHGRAAHPAMSELQSPVPSHTSDQACHGCFILNKKLTNSKQWNKFLHQKLINFDKLLHVVNELERDQQRHLDLQLAYDNRTREWRYQQEQLVQLLQEANPLRERLAAVEAQFAAVDKQLKDCLMDKHALERSSLQLKARIEALVLKVNPVNQEMTEKKLVKKMADNKRLRMELENKNREVHNLNEHISSHKLHYERQGKKSLWALRLAGRLANASGADSTIDEETKERLHSVLRDTESTLDSQYRGFRRLAEARLQDNIIELNALPTMDQWLNDFDKEGLSDWDMKSDVETERGSRRRAVKQEEGSVREEASALTPCNRRTEKCTPKYKMEEQNCKDQSEEDARNMSDMDENREARDRRKRGAYLKKSREEELAVMRAGALIERMFMDDLESNNDAQTEDNANDKKPSPKRKLIGFVSEKKALGSNRGISNRSEIKAVKSACVQDKNTYDDDSDSTSDFIDCGPIDVKDTTHSSLIKKQFLPSNQRFSPRLATRRKSNTDIRPAPVQAVPTSVVRATTEEREDRAPAAPTESFLFGTDSESEDETNNTRPRNDMSNMNPAGKIFTSSADTRPANSATLPAKTIGIPKPCDAREPVHRVGDTIHGRAKVSRVFDRGVVSSCSRKNIRRNESVNLVKLGGTSKVPPKVHNVKELTQLMRENLKEKQRLLSLPMAKPIDIKTVSMPLNEKSTAQSLELPVSGSPTTQTVTDEKQVNRNEMTTQSHSSSDSSDSSSDDGEVDTNQTKQGHSVTKIFPNAVQRDEVSNRQAQTPNASDASKKTHPFENIQPQNRITPTVSYLQPPIAIEQTSPELAILKDDLAMSSSNSDDDDLGSAAESDAAVPSKERITRKTRRRNTTRTSATKLILSDVDLSDASPERPGICNKKPDLSDINLQEACPERPASSTPIKGGLASTPTTTRDLGDFGSIFDSNDEDSCNASGRICAVSPQNEIGGKSRPSLPSTRITENETEMQQVASSFGLDLSLSLTTDEDVSGIPVSNQLSKTTRLEMPYTEVHLKTNEAGKQEIDSEENKPNQCEASMKVEAVVGGLNHDGHCSSSDSTGFSKSDSGSSKFDPVQTSTENNPSNATTGGDGNNVGGKISDEALCTKTIETEIEVPKSTGNNETCLRRTRSRSRSVSKNDDANSRSGDSSSTQGSERKRKLSCNAVCFQTPLKELPVKRTLRNSVRKELNKSGSKQTGPSTANVTAATVPTSHSSSLGLVDDHEGGEEEDRDGEICKQIFDQLIRSSSYLEDDHSDSLSNLVLSSPFINSTPQSRTSKYVDDNVLNDSLDLSKSTDRDDSLPLSSSERVVERRSRPVTRRSYSSQSSLANDPKVQSTPRNNRGRRSTSTSSSRPFTRSIGATTAPATVSCELEDKDLGATNTTEPCQSFGQVSTVDNGIESGFKSKSVQRYSETTSPTTGSLETMTESVMKCYSSSSCTAPTGANLATVDGKPADVIPVSGPRPIKKSLSAKNGCSIIPRQASVSSGLDPTCRVTRRRRNIGMKYTKVGSTEGATLTSSTELHTQPSTIFEGAKFGSTKGEPKASCTGQGAKSGSKERDTQLSCTVRDAKTSGSEGDAKASITNDVQFSSTKRVAKISSIEENTNPRTTEGDTKAGSMASDAEFSSTEKNANSIRTEEDAKDGCSGGDPKANSVEDHSPLHNSSLPAGDDITAMTSSTKKVSRPVTESTPLKSATLKVSLTKCDLKRPTLKVLTRQNHSNADLTADVTPPAQRNSKIKSDQNTSVSSDLISLAPQVNTRKRKTDNAKHEPVTTPSAYHVGAVNAKTSENSLVSARSVEIPGKKTAPMSVQTNEKTVRDESDSEPNETISKEETEQASESGNKHGAQCLWTADMDGQQSVGSLSAKNDATTTVASDHGQDSDGSECELKIDFADDPVHLTRNHDQELMVPNISSVSENQGKTDANKTPLIDAKETVRKVTPLFTKDEDLFGQLSSSSDEDDEPVRTPVTSAEKISTKTQLKEQVVKTPTSETKSKAASVDANTTKIETAKLKGSILDDIITLKNTRTVTHKAVCRHSKTKITLNENQKRELERRKLKSNVLQPAKPALALTPFTNKLPPPKPSLSLGTRRLKNLLSQRRNSQPTNRKQSGALAKGSQSVLTKTQQRQGSSSQSSVTSSPAISETESLDEPIRRLTPGKRSRVICSDSDSDTQDSEKTPKLGTTVLGPNKNLSSFKLMQPESVKKTIRKPAPKKNTDVQSLVERISEKFAPKHKTAILLETKIKPKLSLPSNHTIKKPLQNTPLVMDTPSADYSVPADDKTKTREVDSLSQCPLVPGVKDTISALVNDANTEKGIVPSIKEVSLSLDFTSQDFGSGEVVSCQAKSSCNADESSEDELLQINISACDQESANGSDHELEIDDEIPSHSPTNTKNSKRKAESDSVLGNINKKAKLDASVVVESTSSQAQSSHHSFSLTSSGHQLKPVSFFGTDILFNEEQANPEPNTTAGESAANQPAAVSQASSSNAAPIDGESVTKSSINIPEILPAKEELLQEAQKEYTSIVDELGAVTMGGNNWKNGINKLMHTLQQRIDGDRTLSLMGHLKPLANALVHHIIRTDPLQGLPANASMLCPDLYKLFILMKVIEENLGVGADHPLEELVTTTCHSIVSSSGVFEHSVTLSPGCLASLAAWHTASCCAVRKYGREPQWQRARCFLVTVLCRHPGSAHAALLCSLFLARFVFLRVVKYRPSSGLEHAIMWVAHHGIWVGRDAVRKSLLDNMSGRHAIEKPSQEPLLLVQSVLSNLLHKVDKKTKVPYDTPQNTKTTVLGIVVIACWVGKSWALQELLPLVIQFLATKKNVPSARLVLLSKEIAESVLVQVGACQDDLAQLLDSLLNTETPIAPVKYKDPKMHPNKQLLSTLSDSVADAVRALLTADDDS